MEDKPFTPPHDDDCPICAETRRLEETETRRLEEKRRS